MARRRRRKGGGGGDDVFGTIAVVIKILITAVFALLMLGSVFIIGGWLFFELVTLIKALRWKLERFALSDEEIQELAKAQRDYDKANKGIAAAKAKGSALRTRNDGRFDERSYLGRDLNETIQSLSWRIEASEDKIVEAQVRAVKLIRNYSFWRSYRSAFRMSMLTFVVLAIVFMQSPPNWVIDAGTFLEGNNYLHLFEPGSIAYGVMPVATLGGLLVWFVCALVLKSNVTRKLLRRIESEGLTTPDPQLI